MTASSIPVAIVGAGPVGMVLALELAHQGIESVLIEARPNTTKFPKMDETNARSMELLSRLGITDEIRAVGVGPEYSFDTVFCSSLEGRELARWREPSAGEMKREIEAAVDGSTPAEAWQRVSQEHAETVLMRRCLASPKIDVRRPWRVTDVADDGAMVTIRAEHAETGERETISASYVVGCDGSKSQVRESLGIRQEGTEELLSLALIHFRSRDTDRLQAHGQFWHLYFASGGILIAQDERDTWTLHALVPSDSQPEDLDTTALVHRVTGAPVEIDEVLAQSVWRPNILLAETYRVGRVFLAGDACHQVIPNGGYGMNMGIGDAVDLGWKLAAVLSGWGGDLLLASYEAERRPVAEQNLEWSSRHVSVQLEILDEVDVDLAEQDSAAGIEHRAHLSEFIGERRGEASSPGVEYGYCYHDSPVVVPDNSEPFVLDPTTYSPTTRPGARAPHVPLPDGRSILTMFSRGLTLIDHGGEDGTELVDAARELDIPLHHLVLESTGPSAAVYERRLVLVRPDGHVAWRGDRVDVDPLTIISRAAGRSAAAKTVLAVQR
jgi:2-polyprenyl-6-methoxyphenol hydroxylase-like FAD-dependent oxidoreductase